MEKVNDCISKISSVLTKIIKDQQNYEQFKTYLEKVENDIKYLKKYGTFPKHIPDDSAMENDKQVSHQFQTSKQIALKENLYRVKQERISEVPPNDTKIESSQKENIDVDKTDMPPPQLTNKRNRKIKRELSFSNTRCTRSKTSKQTRKISDNLGRDSEVILQKQSTETIILSDNYDENNRSMTNLSKQIKNNSQDEESKKISKTTRTKTRIEETDNEESGKRIKTLSSNIQEELNVRKAKQVKQKKSQESPENETSIYKDVESNLTNVEETNAVNKIKSQQKLTETYATIKDSEKDHVANILDKTVVIQNPTVVLEKGPLPATDGNVIGDVPKLVISNCSTPNVNNVMTCDEDNITLPKKNTKAIFSSFDQSSIKKSVETFEKLEAGNSSGIPICSTRAKTKTQAKKEQEQSILTPISIKQKGEIKTTKTLIRCVPLASINANKALKSNSINNSLFPTKSASALKIPLQEFTERETKCREKEATNLNSQTEKKEEDEHKQILAEKQKFKKQHEEMERKRQEAFKRALDEKRREKKELRAAEEEQEKLRKALQEERRAARALKQKKAKSRLPIYLREKAPLLCTEDCYDSDQEDVDIRKIKRPYWTSKEKIARGLQVQQFVDENGVNNFLIMEVTTPDLQDIFENIDPKKIEKDIKCSVAGTTPL